MDIILIRHGQTEDNKQRIFSRKDIPLSDKGQEQIKKLRPFVETLTFHKVYVSPLNRTIETMELLGLDGEREERIQEIDFGLFEGRDYETIQKEFPKEAKMWDDDYINYVTPKGESIKIAYERVTSFLDEISKKNEDVLLVCHEGVIRIALSWVFDNSEYFFKFKAENGSVNIINFQEGFKYIKKSNNTIE